MAEERPIRFAVYENRGNKFVVFARDHVVVPGKDGWDSAANVIINRMMWSICMGVKVVEDDEALGVKDGWLELPAGQKLTYVETMMMSPVLMHGGCTVLMIAGPLFDATPLEEKIDDTNGETGFLG